MIARQTEEMLQNGRTLLNHTVQQVALGGQRLAEFQKISGSPGLNLDPPFSYEDASWRKMLLMDPPITAAAVHWSVEIDATWENLFNTPAFNSKVVQVKNRDGITMDDLAQALFRFGRQQSLDLLGYVDALRWSLHNRENGQVFESPGSILRLYVGGLPQNPGQTIWNHATGEAWPSPAPLLWTLQASVEKVLEDYEEPLTPGQALVQEAMENALKQHLSQPIRPKHPDVCRIKNFIDNWLKAAPIRRRQDGTPSRPRFSLPDCEPLANLMSQYGFCTHLRLTFAGTMKSEDTEEINLLTMISSRF
jgi:hypothetical protein